MVYVLLFIGLNQTPAQLGTYNNQQLCESAIRSIYEQQLTPPGIELTSQVRESIKIAVDTKFQYQREYRCLPK